MSKSDEEGCFGIAIVLVAVVLLGGIATWWNASMEAAAYNRVTGKNVSTFDAIFLELRVDGTPKD